MFMKKILIFIFCWLGAANKATAAETNLYNIRVTPILLAAGFVNTEADIKLGEHFTAGPTLGAWNFNIKQVALNTWNFGAQVRYYTDASLNESS
jgi:hypothetical protein